MTWIGDDRILEMLEELTVSGLGPEFDYNDGELTLCITASTKDKLGIRVERFTGHCVTVVITDAYKYAKEKQYLVDDPYNTQKNEQK